MWTIYAITSLLATVICVGLGILVFSRNRRSIINITFANVSILIGLWSLFPFLTDIASSQVKALLYGRIAYLAALVTPAAFFHFVFTFLGTYEKKQWVKYSVWASYVVAGLFLTVSFSDRLIIDVVRRAPGSHVVSGPLYPLFIVFFISLCPYAILQIFVEFQEAIGYRREQLKFLFFGFLVALIAGGMHVFEPYYHVEIFPHDTLLIAWSAIIAYAIVRHHLLDIRSAMIRIGVALLVYAVILGMPFWVVYKTSHWIPGMLLMFVFASMGPFVYYRLQRKAVAILLAQQRRYHDMLMQASAGMVREHDINRLLQMIVRIIKRIVKISYVVAVLDNKEAKAYQVRAKRCSGQEFPDLSFGYEDRLIKHLMHVKSSCTYEELPDEVKQDLKQQGAFGIHLIVPSMIQDRMIGFLVLGSKLNKNLYTQDDISVFQTLSNQGALAIENCLFIQEFRKTQERLFSAEKLASIGGMADGVAHQMKNRMNVLSLAAGEQCFELQDVFTKHAALLEQTPDLKESLRYIRESSESIVTNIKKTNGILKGILDFAKTEEHGNAFDEFALSSAIEQAVSLLKVKHQMAKFPLTVDINPPDAVYGVQAQVLESIYNILDNAYEAVRERMDYHLTELTNEEKVRFQPDIRLKLTHREQSDVIQISDNGMGVNDENRHKIFAPFFTTKSTAKSGSGIGMYVVKRMIEENHQGKIRFESVYGKGMTFFIELPKKGAKKAAGAPEQKAPNGQGASPAQPL